MRRPLLALRDGERTTWTVAAAASPAEAVQDKPVWTLEASIFAPRLKECDARAFFNGPRTWKRMFETDWDRVMATKEKFIEGLKKIGGAKEVKEASTALQKNYQVIVQAFQYFSALGESFDMQLNQYTAFVIDCNIPEKASKSCKQADCDRIFIASNYEADKKSEMAKANDDHALLRCVCVLGVCIRVVVGSLVCCHHHHPTPPPPLQMRVSGGAGAARKGQALRLGCGVGLVRRDRHAHPRLHQARAVPGSHHCVGRVSAGAPLL